MHQPEPREMMFVLPAIGFVVLFVAANFYVAYKVIRKFLSS